MLILISVSLLIFSIFGKTLQSDSKTSVMATLMNQVARAPQPMKDLTTGFLRLYCKEKHLMPSVIAYIVISYILHHVCINFGDISRDDFKWLRHKYESATIERRKSFKMKRKVFCMIRMMFENFIHVDTNQERCISTTNFIDIHLFNGTYAVRGPLCEDRIMQISMVSKTKRKRTRTNHSCSTQGMSFHFAKIDAISKKQITYPQVQIYIDFDPKHMFYGFVNITLEKPMDFVADKYYEAKILVFVTSQIADDTVYTFTDESTCFAGRKV